MPVRQAEIVISAKGHQRSLLRKFSSWFFIIRMTIHRPARYASASCPLRVGRFDSRGKTGSLGSGFRVPSPTIVTSWVRARKLRAVFSNRVAMAQAPSETFLGPLVQSAE